MHSQQEPPPGQADAFTRHLQICDRGVLLAEVCALMTRNSSWPLMSDTQHRLCFDAQAKLERFDLHCRGVRCSSSWHLLGDLTQARWYILSQPLVSRKEIHVSDRTKILPFRNKWNPTEIKNRAHARKNIGEFHKDTHTDFTKTRGSSFEHCGCEPVLSPCCCCAGRPPVPCRFPVHDSVSVLHQDKTN